MFSGRTDVVVGKDFRRSSSSPTSIFGTSALHTRSFPIHHNRKLKQILRVYMSLLKELGFHLYAEELGLEVSI